MKKIKTKKIFLVLPWVNSVTAKHLHWEHKKLFKLIIDRNIKIEIIRWKEYSSAEEIVNMIPDHHAIIRRSLLMTRGSNNIEKELKEACKKRNKWIWVDGEYGSVGTIQTSEDEGTFEDIEGSITKWLDSV